MPPRSATSEPAKLRIYTRWMSRLVYSSSHGRICPTCGWPADNCQCSSRKASASVPEKVVAKLRLEKSGRGGKTVSVIYDLPNNAEFLRTLCSELKKACGTGGSVSDTTIEIQGDQRDRLRALLTKRGFVVRG
jgi:translation initiation factor 1